MPNADQTASFMDRFFYPGLTRTLLFWFLLLALLPLALVCFIGYQQSTQALRTAAVESLTEGTTQQAHFINNWFDFRFKDLRVQAESRQNAEFIKSLAEGLKSSGQTAENYVGSYQWATLVEANKTDLVQLMQIYAYYYDLFLIDLDGNILFSVKQERDLGSNLYTGPYKSTHFAGIVRQSLEAGETLFSDFERYGPSANMVAGFLSAPLIDEKGDKLGVFAAQLKVDTITELTTNSQLSNASQVSYLIGTDLLSRTAIHSPTDVLGKKIETAQAVLWAASSAGAGHNDIERSAFDYVGPFGQKVLGVHQALTIGPVKWGLVSEVDEAEALASARWMARLTILILLFMFFIMVLAAIVVSRRITRPIKLLVGFSERAAAGQLDQQVDIVSQDEVGQLADAFNSMIAARRTYETELKASSEQAQQALLELEAQKFALDQHSLVAITDTAGAITFANQKFVDISGYSYKELIGQNHRLLNSGHHPRAFFQEMYETLTSDAVWNAEICNRAKDGQFYWVDSTILSLKNSKEEVTGYIAIRTDITTRKQAELNSQNSLSIVEATLEASENGVLVLNQHDKAIHYNQNFLDLLHFTREQVIFGDVSSMLEAIISRLKDGKAFAEIVEGVQTSGGVFSDGRVDFKDGQILEFSARELLLPGGKSGHVWSFNDITAQTLAAEELTRAKDEAEEATRVKSDFLANMSHEIRTPMNGVLGMLNLLSNSDLGSKQRHQVRLARSSGEALLTLINDILDFSKIEAGKLEMESIDFDLRQLLGELAESMALQAQSKGLEIVLDLTQIEQSRVKGDPTRIRQVFTNLIGNALKFTTAGEVVIRAAFEAGAEGEVILSASVSDTGIGIPSSRVKYLFDSFSQVDASTTRKFGGTGLGLAIVKSLCELMGGGIKVTSEPGGGSCFAFTLRLGVSEQTALVRPSVDLGGVRILIVDDNTTNLEVLEQQLSLWGAYVTEADGAASALRILDEQAEEPFAVAIVDMQMPEMDGASLGKAIRADARFQSTQLIMMTSMSEPGDARFFADLGFAAYFPKPTTTSDLFDALAVVLGGGEALLAANPLVTHNYLQSLIKEPGRTSTQSSHDRRASRLLLVEDNVINQQVAIGMLEDMGYCPDIAENGAVAIEMLRQAADDLPYDLILMDCQMPVLDGYAATAKIRSGEAGERNCNISIVAMTANAMAGDRATCLQAGMNDYIPKPIDPDILESSLTRYLTKSQSGKTPINAPEPTAGTDINYPSNKGRESVQVEAMGTPQQEMVWDREGLLKRVRG
ncbi:MAG: response regulator, partial [Gammaproteobacteria bacterium]|nr:response regulator [Gammaproteobacteria bacterium]